MSKHTRASHPVYHRLPTEIEGFDSLAELALDTVGLMTLHRIKDVPRPDWATPTAAQVMLPLEQLKHTDPDAGLWTAFQQMDRDGINQRPVMTETTVAGMLSREDVITFLRTVQELGT